MSPLPLTRPVVRALSLTAISVLLVTGSLVWASRQQAGSPSFKSARNHSSFALFADKGGITPDATTITVNSLSDVSNSSDGLCTLREAIIAADNKVASGTTAGECPAGTGTDAIIFSVTGTITLTSALPNIATDVTITGPGANTLAVSGNNATRVFRVTFGTVGISKLTITGGFVDNSEFGGGISNTAFLTLSDAVVTGNSGGHGGGGIYNEGSLALINTSINNNTSPSFGGGLYNNSGTATLTNCRVAGNSTETGGGIFNASGILTLMGTTVSGNTASFNGGGIYNIFPPSSLTLINSIVTGNSATAEAGGIFTNRPSKMVNSTISKNISGSGGGGIQAFGEGPVLVNCTVTENSVTSGDGGGILNAAILRNTIVANNTASGVGPDLKGTFTSNDYNLVGNTGGASFTGTTTHDITNQSALLAPLASNGGPTQTYALLTGSPAIDAGNNCVTDPAHCSDVSISQITTDQRGQGFSRRASTAVDIGAYERQTPLANLPDTSTNEDTQLLVAFDGGDTGTITSVTATSSNATLVPNDVAHLSVAIIGSTGLVTINPATNLNGSLNGTTDVTVTVNRTGGTESKTFTLTVNPVNDAPSFTGGANQAVNEDAPAQVINSWATNMLTGGASDESGQTLTFQVTGNTNPSLFSAGPAINSSGTLTYTPAANANGSSNITINLKDDGGTANGGSDTSALQGFTITVNAVNDAPSFTKGADQTVNEDSGAQTVTNWATAISRGPADESGQTLTFQITNNTNAPLFSAGPAISSTGTLTYTPAANANGSATVTINLKDSGGTANGGIDTSASQTFTITVNAINDAPSFTKGANQTVNEDAGAQTVNIWATNISSGPSDESGQTVGFNITGNTNVGLFSAGPAVSSTGTLTYTPAANANGSATITLTAQDNGGTANGGVDTSASQTFTISVNAVNDAPSFVKGADQTVNEDSGLRSVSNWATSISAGATDESGQALTFQVTNNTNAALFSGAPAISSTGTLTFTPAANANGTATITIQLKDNGGTANGGVDTSASQTFVINVNAVNDAPSFTKGANQTVNNNVGPQTVANWATNISPGPGNESAQTVTFQVTGNTNPGLFTAGPAISSTGTLTYTPSASAGGTATITINLTDDGGTANGGVDTSSSQTFTITVVNPTGGFVNFQSSTANTTESSGSTTVNVVRTGDTSKAMTVNYATNADPGVPCSTANGVASPKCDFTAALGTLNFAAGETSKPITILLSQDSFVEGPEAITLTLSNPTNGALLSTPSSMSVTIADDATEPPTNIIDDAGMFVRMHYHDFLNREADQSGLDFWTGQMTNCGSPDLLVCRVNVSGAFFLSIEFQQTGYLAERMYRTAYGQATATSTLGGSHAVLVPIVRANEFLTDTQRIGRGVVVLAPGWEQALENNKQAYALEFVQTARFIAAFPTSRTPTQFVDQLNQNAGLVLSASERTTAINLFGIAADTTNVNARARALRQIAEDQDLYNAEFNRAFVLAQYIGYLRRNPNDAPESSLDYTGYEFWLNKLTENGGDYIKAEMVKAFISSSEYRQRFGP